MRPGSDWNPVQVHEVVAKARRVHSTSREFRDVVFEDVGFEHNSLLTLNN